MFRLSEALPALILLLLFYGCPLQSQQALTDTSIVQNGGFESGLDGWQQIQVAGGFLTLSNTLVHSGSAALGVSLPPPRPGANGLSPIVEGVTQSSNVTNLRGLRVGAWYLLRTNTYLVAARVRVQVGLLTINYYAVTSPNTVLTNKTNTRSVSSPPQNCAPWCQLQADVGADIRSNFEPAASASVFQSTGTIPIKIALEFILYGGTDRQIMYWDDVALTASIPSQITTTQTTTSATQTLVTVSTSTVTSTQTVGFVLTREQSYLIIVPALILISIAILIELVRRKHARQAKNTWKPDESSRAVQVVGIRCRRCHSVLMRGDRFCDRCGARQ